MMLHIDIRHEQDSDYDVISTLVENAFGQPDEARLVEALRGDGHVEIAMVAVEHHEVVGHVVLSSMQAPFRALGLAPLAVLPERRRRGIGRALTNAALARAKLDGWDAVFVLGDEGYYRRFGFRPDLAAGFESPYAGPHFMVAPLQGELPQTSGKIDYAPAFAAL